MAIVRTNDANNSSTNRHVTFHVEPVAGERAADMFVALQGPNTYYPYYGKVASPTLLQELAQLRLSLVTRVITQWAIVVGVQITEDGSANAGGGVNYVFETDRSGVFFNNAWPTTVIGGGSAADKHAPDGTQGVGTAGWITDTVGTGGMVSGPKEKRGLQLLVQQELAGVNYGAATQGPFQGGTTVVLPDGRVVTGAPALTAGTMVVTYVEPTTIV